MVEIIALPAVKRLRLTVEATKVESLNCKNSNGGWCQTVNEYVVTS